jgi:hypothetical protein
VCRPIRPTSQFIAAVSSRMQPCDTAVPRTPPTFSSPCFALVGVPVLVFALARVSIRNREQIDRLIPPRRWELALRRRLGL